MRELRIAAPRIARVATCVLACFLAPGAARSEDPVSGLERELRKRVPDLYVFEIGKRSLHIIASVPDEGDQRLAVHCRELADVVSESVPDRSASIRLKVESTGRAERVHECPRIAAQRSRRPPRPTLPAGGAQGD